MGLFSKITGFKKQRDEKKIAKSIATIKNAKAIKEDRQAAIDYFCELDDAEVAVPALLQRFEYSLEHGINDTREKEACMKGILAHQENAFPLIVSHLATTNRIAWPIKCLKSISTDEQVVNALQNTLDFTDVRFDQAKVDKNYDILCHLIDYKSPEFIDKAAHFLADPDERVRFAATEFLVEQGDEKAAKHLEVFLKDSTPDNIRIRQAVIQAFEKFKWKVVDVSPFANGQVVGPFFVNSSGNLERRV